MTETLTNTPSPNREQLRDDWLKNLSALLGSVEEWVRDAGWSTRRLTKRMDDPGVGIYEVPTLVMQEGSARALLEPITRCAVGGRAVVDLYIMPAYDDVASLAFDGENWHIYYGDPARSSGRDAVDSEPVPLSKEGFLQILAEMKNRVIFQG